MCKTTHSHKHTNTTQILTHIYVPVFTEVSFKPLGNWFTSILSDILIAWGSLLLLRTQSNNIYFNKLNSFIYT